MITSIYFENFKALRRYSISLRDFNILVGQNNSGKSTILDALRILYGAYRYSSRFKPTLIQLPNNKVANGWEIPDSSIPIQLENIQTNFTEEPAIIKYRFGHEKFLFVHFSSNRPTTLTYEPPKNIKRTAAAFRKEFNLRLSIIPTLGPFEINEDLVTEKYLNRWSGSRRASRLFRNIWFQEPEQFYEFKTLVEDTWDGMSILPPEKPEIFDSKLTMFFEENRLAREICWAGFGFQIWLQLLTHIIKNKDSDIIVVDEPEIYLHPDLQHKILHILKSINTKVLLATHSVEIINEAEPSDVLVISRDFKSAKRLSDISGLQKVSDLIGSNQNIHLTRLARGKRILFVEGKDIKLLKKLSKICGYENLFENNNLTVIPIEGFSQHDKISGTNWSFSKVITESIQLSALFDRDYRCEEEINEFINNLESETEFVHVLKRKEIENYLLHPKSVKKAIALALKKTKSKNVNDADLDDILVTTANKFKTKVQSQRAARKFDYTKTKGHDLATVIEKEQKYFEENWECFDFKINVVPGKEFISVLNHCCPGNRI